MLNKFERSYETLGRLWGLREAWGKESSAWTKKQHSRMSELYLLLTPVFVTHIFTCGLPSNQIFLQEMANQIFGD